MEVRSKICNSLLCQPHITHRSPWVCLEDKTDLVFVHVCDSIVAWFASPIWHRDVVKICLENSTSYIYIYIHVYIHVYLYLYTYKWIYIYLYIHGCIIMMCTLWTKNCLSLSVCDTLARVARVGDHLPRGPVFDLNMLIILSWSHF